jgi:chromosome segregation ATPase
MVITKKNLEMSKFKERQEEKEMYMEDVLSAEKIFNKNSINQEFGKLNNKIKDYKLTINDNNEKINNYEKINKELKSKEVLLKTQLEKIIQKNEKLSDNNIELTKELRQKYQDNSDLAKLLEQSKKEQVESIKKLDSAHQADIDCLKIKLKELSENIKEKENEDSKKYQQYINMKEQFSQLLKEKEIHLHQIKELSFDIREKNKKIDELLQTQESTITDLNLSLQNDEDILFYKKIDKGLRCIFVPFYENIFVCINLSQNLERGKGENDIYNLSNYECKYILDLNSFNKELSKMIVDYSLIVIGKISKLTELEQTKNKFLNLPEDKQFILVTLGKVDYVIGFPENELMFNNYVN